MQIIKLWWYNIYHMKVYRKAKLALLLSSQSNEEAMAAAERGIELWHERHRTQKLLVCGGLITSEDKAVNTPQALMMKNLAISAHVPSGDIVVYDKSTSHEDELSYAANYLDKTGGDTLLCISPAASMSEVQATAGAVLDSNVEVTFLELAS